MYLMEEEKNCPLEQLEQIISGPEISSPDTVCGLHVTESLTSYGPDQHSAKGCMWFVKMSSIDDSKLSFYFVSVTSLDLSKE